MWETKKVMYETGLWESHMRVMNAILAFRPQLTAFLKSHHLPNEGIWATEHVECHFGSTDLSVHPLAGRGLIPWYEQNVAHALLGISTGIWSFEFYVHNWLCMGLHGGVVVSTLASQQEGSGFESPVQPGPFCVACSPRVGFSPGSPASSHTPKTCRMGLGSLETLNLEPQ